MGLSDNLVTSRLSDREFVGASGTFWSSILFFFSSIPLGLAFLNSFFAGNYAYALFVGILSFAFVSFWGLCVRLSSYLPVKPLTIGGWHTIDWRELSRVQSSELFTSKVFDWIEFIRQGLLLYPALWRLACTFHFDGSLFLSVLIMVPMSNYPEFCLRSSPISSSLQNS